MCACCVIPRSSVMHPGSASCLGLACEAAADVGADSAQCLSHSPGRACTLEPSPGLRCVACGRGCRPSLSWLVRLCLCAGPSCAGCCRCLCRRRVPDSQASASALCGELKESKSRSRLSRVPVLVVLVGLCDTKGILKLFYSVQETCSFIFFFFK